MTRHHLNDCVVDGRATARIRGSVFRADIHQLVTLAFLAVLMIVYHLGKRGSYDKKSRRVLLLSVFFDCQPSEKAVLRVLVKWCFLGGSVGP
jgi:hypothetical protein